MEIIWEKKAAKTIAHARIVPSTNWGSSVPSSAGCSMSVGGVPLISVKVTSESWCIMTGMDIPFSSEYAMMCVCVGLFVCVLSCGRKDRGREQTSEGLLKRDQTWI